MLDAALNYLKDGCSVLPVGKMKAPFVKWEEFQTRYATEEEVRSWWDRWPDAGVGIVTGGITGISVTDFDLYKPNATPIPDIPEHTVCPISETPRQGRHLFWQYDERVPNDSNVGGNIGFDCRNDGGYIVAPPTKNGDGFYKWIVPFDRSLLSPVPDSIIALINKDNTNIYGRKILSKSQDVISSHIKSQLFSLEGSRNSDLFHVANMLFKGGAREEEVYYIIEILANNCNPPYPLKEISNLINSAKKREVVREKNISETVREFLEVTTGHFKVTDLYNESQLVTKKERHAAMVELTRLCSGDKPILQKAGSKRGEYEIVDYTCNDIDYLGKMEDPLKIKLPLDIHELVEIMPGNVIIIAGEPNAGKTSWLFNFTKMNMHQYDITYFSSEMGKEELQKRLLKIEDVPLDGWKCHFKEMDRGFERFVKPGKGNINIIDYLELYEDFYKAGGNINNIFRKLDGAIAVIAIQKNPGQNVGIGGFRTIEKARLALALSHGRIDIVKAKNWATPENPNGKYCEFKIIQGGHMYATSSWLRDKK